MIKFRVTKFGDLDFGFFPEVDEQTQHLYDLLCKNFAGFDKKAKTTSGLMSHIRVKGRENLQFWSKEVSNYVHQLGSTTQDFFAFKFDDNQKVIISPDAKV